MREGRGLLRAELEHSGARSDERRHYAVLALLIALGVVLRLLRFESREAFWSDEAALALNIVDRSWSELGRPFVHAQVAPYLFAAGEKVVTWLAGISEASLRAWSLVAGLAFLPVLYTLGRVLAGARAGSFAVAAAATTPLLVHYSTELKPYATDALVSALIALATARVLTAADPKARRRALWQLGIGGALAPWLSLPSVFVLAGSGVALAVATPLRRSARQWLVLAAIGCSWLASFGLHYASFLQLLPADAAFMRRYWASFDGFAPFPPASLTELRWYAGKFFYMFAGLVTSVGHGQRYIAAATWALGIWLLWRKHRALPLLAVVPIALMFAASAAHAYVIADRLTLFLAPLLLVPCAAGLAWLAQLRPPVTHVAAVAIVVALASEHTLHVANELRTPQLPSDIRTLVGYLRERIDVRDEMCVEDRVAWGYEYYARRAGVWQPFEVIQVLEPDPVRARAEQSKLSKFAGAPRVWLIVPTLGPIGPPNPAGTDAIVSAEQRMLAHFRRFGRQVDMFDATNVRLYLYDLSQSARVGAGGLKD